MTTNNVITKSKNEEIRESLISKNDATLGSGNTIGGGTPKMQSSFTYYIILISISSMLAFSLYANYSISGQMSLEREERKNIIDSLDRERSRIDTIFGSGFTSGGSQSNGYS